MALPWFDTTPSPITITSSQELSLALGTRSIVYILGTSGVTLQLFGIATVGGNVDGAVATIVNISNLIGTQYTFVHESGSASSPANRFLNLGASNQTPASIGSATYRYFGGSTNRWVMMNKS